jgi:hypothetical protein
MLCSCAAESATVVWLTRDPQPSVHPALTHLCWSVAAPPCPPLSHPPQRPTLLRLAPARSRC